MAARRTRHDDYVTNRLETAGDLLDEAIERSRGLSHELSPPMLRMRGLIPALRVLASEAQRTQNLRVTISAPQEDPNLSPLAGQVTYRAVQELLFNIIKHAGVDEATVDLAERDAGLEIAVRDHGRGFDVESALKQDSPTGLGLLSLRERIEAIGGVLEIQSIVGAGSTFTIFLPSSATMAEGVLKETTPEFAGKPRNGRKLSVLVVDDHAVIRQGLVLLLNEEPDLEVVGEASGGDAAVELAHQLLPDVVVMDLAMPGLAGDEATRAILSKAPDTRIVGLSMHSEEEARDRMMSSGAAAEYFYRGPIAERIVAFSDENGGLFTLADFANFTEYGLVEPLSIEYRGLTVYQNPPNSQGIAQLQALQILEGFDFSSRTPDDPEVIHLMSEAIKLAFVDRNRYVADPNFVDVPVAELLSDEHAARQRARISLDEALEWPIEDRLGMAGDERRTTTFHVIDRYGNAAAVTTSIGVSFLIAGETGIHMNERLTFMHKDADDVNRVDGGKKVRHSSGPHMVLRDGAPWIIGGNTGADFQPQGQLQQFIWIVEFGLGAQEAIDRPRFEPQAFAATFRPWAIQNRLQLEPGRFSDEVQADLAARGHTIQAGGTVGAANLILVDDHSSGRIEAGWESREADSYGMVEMAE